MGKTIYQSDGQSQQPGGTLFLGMFLRAVMVSTGLRQVIRKLLEGSGLL